VGLAEVEAEGGGTAADRRGLEEGPALHRGASRSMLTRNLLAICVGSSPEW